MRTISDAQLAVPGLVVIDVAAADDASLWAVVEHVRQRWVATAPGEVWHEPGEPGLRTRVCVDLRPLEALGQEEAAWVDPTTG